MNYTDNIEKMKKIVHKMVKPSRYEHSVRVAETAAMMCEKFDFDVNRGYFAGIVHDMCKQLDAKKLIQLAKEDGRPITDIELDKPSLLHGRAAAIMLANDYGVTDKDLLEAVRVHVSGMPGMSQFSKILFVADKVEPGRSHIPENYWAIHEADSLDQLMISVLEDNLRYLNEMGYEVLPQTEELLYSLIKEKD